MQFSASNSTAPNDAVVAWEWDFDGDGSVDARTRDVEHSFAQEGTFSVSLVVRSNSGARSFPSVKRIFIGNSPPVVTIMQPPEGTVIIEGEPATLAGSAVDPEEGEMPCADLVWDVRVGHNSHAHPVAETFGCEASFVPLPGGHRPGQSLFLAVELRATDRDGPGDDSALTGTASRVFEVQVRE